MCPTTRSEMPRLAHCPFLNCPFEDLTEIQARRDERIDRVLLLLEQQLHAPPDLQKLAEEVGLSVSRLSHLFSRQLGISLRRYHHARRLAEAARLLLTTDRRISEICFSLGWNSIASFDRAFRRQFAGTPSEFRQNQTRMPAWQLRSTI